MLKYPQKKWTFYLLFSICCVAFSDNALAQTNKGKRTVRAVIVGISDYLEIKDLNYAHQDAVDFKAFLQSKVGGEIASENIKLLQNSSATTDSIRTALYWLARETKEDDLAILFFSGHGGKEGEDFLFEPPSYFLTHDTPKDVYSKGYSFEDVERVVNSIVLKRKGKVWLFLDACRAGGLDIRGSRLSVDDALKLEASEIKMLSCKPDEKSYEKILGKKGNGIFTRYLLLGLKGVADEESRDQDQVVTVDDLAAHLKYYVKNASDEKQTPLIQGEGSASLAIVNPDALQLAMEEVKFINSGSTESDLGIAAVARIAMPEATNSQKVAPKGLEPLTKEDELKETFDQAIKKREYLFADNGAFDIYIKYRRNENPSQELLDYMYYAIYNATHHELNEVLDAFLASGYESLETELLQELGIMLYDLVRFSEDEDLMDMEKAHAVFIEGLLLEKNAYEGLEMFDERSIQLFEETNSSQGYLPYVHYALALAHKEREDFILAREYAQNANQLAPQWDRPVLLMAYIEQKKHMDMAMQKQEAIEEAMRREAEAMAMAKLERDRAREIGALMGETRGSSSTKPKASVSNPKLENADFPAHDVAGMTGVFDASYHASTSASSSSWEAIDEENYALSFDFAKGETLSELPMFNSLDTSYEMVMIKPEEIRYVEIPAVYSSKIERVLVEEAKDGQPAKYETRVVENLDAVGGVHEVIVPPEYQRIMHLDVDVPTIQVFEEAPSVEKLEEMRQEYIERLDEVNLSNIYDKERRYRPFDMVHIGIQLGLEELRESDVKAYEDFIEKHQDILSVQSGTYQTAFYLPQGFSTSSYLSALFFGIKLLEEEEAKASIRYLEKAEEIYPDGEAALFYLMLAHKQAWQEEKSKAYARRLAMSAPTYRSDIRTTLYTDIKSVHHQLESENLAMHEKIKTINEAIERQDQKAVMDLFLRNKKEEDTQDLSDFFALIHPNTGKNKVVMNDLVIFQNKRGAYCKGRYYDQNQIWEFDYILLKKGNEYYLNNWNLIICESN